ncbi:hypothetical protein CSKR_203764 [Clonorchis sinensis]|uniref:Uncharacterized protein n=1 Tax=Clonorchis sinensis TaxID=79923 RepID=A0A8T1MGZ7_CLOSI|nr:hypothetical protein CSKR_200744 [Clonorchis sinensis]KAG5454941.1 hypothetical protein CSKR_203764 [Clonorchis sinensis]
MSGASKGIQQFGVRASSAWDPNLGLRRDYADIATQPTAINSTIFVGVLGHLSLIRSGRLQTVGGDRTSMRRRDRESDVDVFTIVDICDQYQKWLLYLSGSRKRVVMPNQPKCPSLRQHT